MLLNNLTIPVMKRKNVYGKHIAYVCRYDFTKEMSVDSRQLSQCEIYSKIHAISTAK